MLHVRITCIGRIGLVAAVANRIVNRLPGPFVRLRDIHQICPVISRLVDTPTTFKSDFGFTLLPSFGRYHHNAVGTARTPQGGRSGIFQNRDRFDILRVYQTQRVRIRIRYTVDYDQCIRIVLARRTNTADTDTHIQARLTVDCRNLQTRNRPFQSFG